MVVVSDQEKDYRPNTRRVPVNDHVRPRSLTTTQRLLFIVELDHLELPQTHCVSKMAKVLRAPKVDLYAILASQNPQIDLRLEAYEVSTRNFLKAVSNYTQRALSEISIRKNAHVSEKKRISEKLQYIETETNHCKVKEIELISGMCDQLRSVPFPN